MIYFRANVLTLFSYTLETDRRCFECIVSLFLLTEVVAMRDITTIWVRKTTILISFSPIRVGSKLSYMVQIADDW